MDAFYIFCHGEAVCGMPVALRVSFDYPVNAPKTKESVVRVALRLMFVALIAAALIAPASHAFAAPVPFERMEVTVISEQGGSMLLISGALPEGTPLPAQVEIPAPAGAELVWAGELLGGPLSEDPEAKPTVTTAGGNKVYTFTLTKGRTGVVEVTDNTVLSFDGTAYTSNLTYTAPTALKELTLNVRVPSNSSLLSAAEGATGTAGPDGFGLYSRTVKNVKAGQTEDLKFTYSVPTSATGVAPVASTGSNDTFVLVLVLAAVAGALSFAAFSIHKKMKAGALSTGPGTADEDDEVEVVSAGNAEFAVADDEDTDGNLIEEPVAKSKTPLFVVGAVAAIIAMFALVALNSGGAAVQQGDKISIQVAQVDSCTSSRIPLVVPAGGDLAKDSQKILELLRTVPGVGTGTITLSESVIDVDYCDSSASEAQIRAALAPSGYVQAVDPGAPAATETPAAQ